MPVEEQQTQLADTLGADTSIAESTAGATSAAPPQQDQPDSWDSLAFLREQNVDPEKYGFKDHRTAFEGVWGRLGEVSVEAQRYKAELARQQQAYVEMEKQLAALQPKQAPAEKKEWGKLPDYNEAWSYQSNDELAQANLRKHIQALNSRTREFHNDPIGYMKDPLNEFLGQILEEREKKRDEQLQQQFAALRHEMKLPWFLHDREKDFFDDSGPTPLQKNYMQIYQKLIASGASESQAMELADEFVRLNAAPAKAAVKQAAAAEPEEPDESPADKKKREALERHNRVPNRNGSEPRSRSDGPQNKKLSSRSRFEAVFDKVKK